MEFLVQSTVSVLTGSAVIIAWLGIGLVGVRLWAALFSNRPIVYNWPTKLAIAGGVLTLGFTVFWGVARGLGEDPDDAY